MNNIISVIAEFLERAMTLRTNSELKTLEEEISSQIENTPENVRLMKAAFTQAFELICMREDRDAEESVRRIELSEAERNEKQLVQRLLDYNLFTYHFQPIVRADTGEVYSYEALMRAKDMQGITPFHILKYAELSHRLGDVEQYTFLNVLKYISEFSELFEGRKVFINSMPNVRIDPAKLSEIEHLLQLHSKQIVVEMTESSEFDDKHLEEIKDRFRRFGVPIAIDDFGTGYSNISNLLRYKPDYVKIDRSLLSGIQDSHSKRHLVREIIDFCHSNEIMALAEGVETSEELRTVILMGIDLIQGYYTARPSPEIIRSIPYEIKSEIKAHHTELEDGQKLKMYQSSNGERISLERLQKGGYNKLLVGAGWSEGTVMVSGDPHLDTDIHIETADGFKGVITLENVHLLNQVERPCIDIGENADVTLLLLGENKLTNSGIRVPYSSKITFEGKGCLTINLGSADYYGIGNDTESQHGELIFDQDGTVTINAESHAGVCIGSGLGGEIHIRRGRYVIRASGAQSVGIGSVLGVANIHILGCDLDVIASGAYSVAMGSMYGSVDINLVYSSVKCRSESQRSVGIGTVTGKKAKINVESVNLSVRGSGDLLTAMGSLDGESEVTIARSSVKVKGEGTSALVFGSPNGNTKIVLTDIELVADMRTAMKVCAVADEDDVYISGGNYRIKLGDWESDKLVF